MEILVEIAPFRDLKIDNFSLWEWGRKFNRKRFNDEDEILSPASRRFHSQTLI
jgi:hypothetical protein